MATLTLAGITAVLNLVYGDAMADQIRRDVLLPNIIGVFGDRNGVCTWPAKMTGRTSARAADPGVDPGDAQFTSHNRRQASLAWARYEAYAKVDGVAQSIASANAGNGVSSDLLMEEAVDAVDELAVLVSTDTYAGTVGSSPVEISGLDEAVKATGIYAGINQGGAGNSEWAAAENTLATASLSVANLRNKLHRPFKDNCGLFPEFVTCNGTMFDKVGDLFGSERRYMQEVTTAARGTVNLKLVGGYRAIEVDGIPYIEDRHATANKFYAHHSSSISYRQVPHVGSQASPEQIVSAMKALTGVTLSREDVAAIMGERGSRLQPSMIALAKTGDNMKLLVTTGALQLRQKYRNRSGVLTLV